MKKNNKKWIYISLAALVIVLVVAALIKGNSSKKATSVFTSKVELRNIEEQVSGSGKIYPEIEVKMSSDVSGQIIKLFVEEGDSVKVDQTLAIVNPDTYESIVERLRASLNSAKAQLANSKARIQGLIADKEQISARVETAKKAYERNKILFDQNVISEVELEQSLTNLRTLEANFKSAEANINSARQSTKAAEYSVTSAQASLKEARTNLSKTTIKSPISGIITMLAVEEGERVVGTMQMTGTELMRISNLDNMEVRVEISENDILKVKKGDSAVIEVDAYVDRKFTGEVFEVANSSSNISSGALNSDRVTNFIVKIRINKNSYSDLLADKSKAFPFRPGMSATVDIFTTSKKNVVSVPIQAVTTRAINEDKKEERKKDEINNDDLEEVVFIVRNDTVQKVKVKTGIQDDNYIEIVEGLEDSMKVVTGPYNIVSKKLKQGDRVSEKN